MPRRKSGPPVIVPAVQQQEWFSFDRLESLTDISKWTWRKWVANGQVASAKIGSRVVVSRAELDRVMNEATRPRKTGKIIEASGQVA